MKKQEGMRTESASKSGAEIAGDTLCRVGKYAYFNIKQQKNGNNNRPSETRFNYFCFGKQIRSSIQRHRVS